MARTNSSLPFRRSLLPVAENRAPGTGHGTRRALHAAKQSKKFAGHSPCKESSGQLSRRFAVPRSGPVCVWGGGGPLLHYSLPPIGPRVARVLTQNTGARRVPRKLALGRAFQLSTLCLIFFSPGHTILKVSGHVRAQIHGPAKRKCTLLLRNLLWVLHQLVDRLAKW